MSCFVFGSKDTEVSWDGPSSSTEELPTRRRLRRMDALNPMLLRDCNSEVNDCGKESSREILVRVYS